jgi:hypothetical protein
MNHYLLFGIGLVLGFCVMLFIAFLGRQKRWDEQSKYRRFRKEVEKFNALMLNPGERQQLAQMLKNFDESQR